MTQAAYLMDDIREVNWGQATSDVAQGAVDYAVGHPREILTGIAVGVFIGAAAFFGGAVGLGIASAIVTSSLLSEELDSKNDMEK